MKNLLALLLSSLLLVSCRNTFDHEKETAAILGIHHAQRDYHLNAEAEAFARQMSDDFISVNRGIISEPTFEENLRRFDSYFNAVQFQKWDDQEEPVIRFSDDGSLAYSIVQKRVELSYPEMADSLIGRTDFAWVAIHRKTASGWKIEAVASTNQPDEYLPDQETRLRSSLRKFNDAFVAADTALLGSLLTADYVHTNGSSAPVGRQPWLSYVASRKTALENGTLQIIDYQTSDLEISWLENAAIVNAKVTVEQVQNGQRQKSIFRVTHVWKDEYGVWKRAAFHDGKIN